MTWSFGGQYGGGEQEFSVRFGRFRSSVFAGLDTEFFCDTGRIKVPWYRFILVFDELSSGFVFDVSTGFWNIDVSGPENCVGNESGGFGASPIPVEVTTGVAETAATVFIFGSPSDVLRFTFGDSAADIGVTAVRTIWAIHGVGGCDRGEDWCNAFHVVAETHVEVPLVASFEGFYTASDWVIG